MGKKNFIIVLLLCNALFFLHCSQPAQNNTAAQNSLLVTTGRYLFYDRRLSVNNTKACGSCHAQEFSFTDGYTRSIGALGDLHQRNTKPLINLQAFKYYTSSDSAIQYLEQQMNGPMFNTHPIEMGIKGNETIILKRLQADSMYQHLFAQSFAGQQQLFTMVNVKKAIAAFEKTITAYNSQYDNFSEGDSSALTTQQQQGRALFFSANLKCGQCHDGNNFSTPNLLLPNGNINYYHNTGLYNINNCYPAADAGLFITTGNKTDNGKFKVPSLRNIALTAPYYHNGSALTLDDVIDNYSRGGRLITKGNNKGDGKTNRYKSPLINGFALTLQERNALISFLYALTDSSLLTNPAYANPFTNDETKR